MMSDDEVLAAAERLRSVRLSSGVPWEDSSVYPTRPNAPSPRTQYVRDCEDLAYAYIAHLDAEAAREKERAKKLEQAAMHIVLLSRKLYRNDERRIAALQWIADNDLIPDVLRMDRQVENRLGIEAKGGGE